MAITMREALLRISEPATTITNEDKQGWRKVFVPTDNFVGFAGHFPNHPVLPAVVQIIMAECTVEEGTGKQLQMEQLSQAKFTMPVLPNARVLCDVFMLSDNKFSCTITADDALSASFTWKGHISETI